MEELEVEQTKECIERLKILESKYNVSKNVRKEFEKDGTIYYSEDQGYLKGILYWLHNEQEWLEKVRDIEKLYNIKVYHCILTHFVFGDVLSLLYVGNDKDEWEQERWDLDKQWPIIYALNLSDQFMSEFGTIGINKANGGLYRTC